MGRENQADGFATPNQVRATGVLFAVGGAMLIAFYQDLYLQGIVPMRWVGSALVGFGAWCLLAPGTPWLRARLGRLFAAGDPD